MMEIEKLKGFRDDVKRALAEVEGKYGVSVEIGDIRYDDISCRMPLVVKKNEYGGKPIEQVEFERDCHRVGLGPEDYRIEFEYGGTKYRLVGVKPRSPVYPLVVERIKDGKRYKLMQEVIREIWRVSEQSRSDEE